MKRITIILLFSALAIQTAFAAGRADEILEKLASGFRSMKSYGVSFEVLSGENNIRGSYAVEGENYRIELGDAEVYSDGKTRYEIDNRRREVTIDRVDRTSRNILNNPVRAFDFLGADYSAELVSETDGKAVIRLTPTSKEVSPAGGITVTVDTATMRPLSLLYDYDGEQVRITVLGVTKLDSRLKGFAKGNYEGYEFIDFR